jgi:hypothetical protein
MFLVGIVFYFLIPITQPGIPPQYQNADLFRTWSGWTARYMVFHPFAYGFVFAAIFVGLRRTAHFPSGMRGGLLYGTGVFVVGSLPVFLLIFASLQVSGEILVTWVIQSLAQYLSAGMVVGAVDERMTVRVNTRRQTPAS